MTHDDLIEEIARAVEEGSIIDLCGVLSKRKRDREDALLRKIVREEQRAEIGRLIRAFKRGKGRDPVRELLRIREAGGSLRYDRFIDISEEAASRSVSIEAVVALSGNSIPSNAYFVATLTEKGRMILANVVGATEAKGGARANAG